MKIRCEYCDNSFNDTLETCPYCGAPNAGVVRTSKEQPTTIAQLQKWYQDRGLPPYETTRFFIGQDYKKPRAFGIYQDPQSKNFVVYKNLDSGVRKIRYEGSDEAYAVNELFMRLKEEILQQKAVNVKKGQTGGQNGKRRKKAPRTPIEEFMHWIKLCVCLSPLLFILAAGIGVLIEAVTIPDVGYYQTENGLFYHASDDTYDGWFAYSDVDDWQAVDMEALHPDIYNEKDTAKNYLIADSWDRSLSCTNAVQAISVADYLTGREVSTGYYSYDDTTYYHLSRDIDYEWYVYNNGDWQYINAYDLPEDMRHSSMVSDFYYTPTWDSQTQLSDFTETSYYSDYISEQNRSDSDDYDWDDDDYDWDSDSSWDSSSTDWDSDW